MPTATLTSKGQITIPREVRQQLNLVTGDRLEFQVEPDGSVRLRHVTTSVHELFGMLRRPGRRGRTLAQIDRDLVAALAADDARIRRSRR